MRKRPKILFVGQFPPPIHGVSVINRWIIKSETLRERFEFDVLNIATAKEIRDIGQASLSKYLKSAARYFQLLIKLLFRRPEAMYITISPVAGPFFKDSIFVLIAQLFGIPRILHLHGKGVANYLQQNPRYLGYYNFVFKNSIVVHLSKSLLRDLAPLTSYKSLEVLNNGIPDRHGSRISTQTHHILYISNLIETKGGLDLLQAYNLVKPEYPDVRLSFVGDWGETKFQSAFMAFLRDHNLSDQVQLPGTLQGLEKHRMLASADIFVMPTFYPNECFPLTILEAMSHGLPVISTFEGAIPDIIDNGITGYLVPSKEPEQLADRIKLLLENDKSRLEMGENARNKYLQKYTFSIFERNFAALLQNALEK